MSDSNQNKLNNQAFDILKEYQELMVEINLLFNEEDTSKSRIRGAISSAGVTTENLLIYIIRKEGREDKLLELRSNQRGLFEYKRILDDLIPQKQKIHIGTIIPWRNLANHHNDNESVNEEELKSVETAINSLVKWFFDVYLKGEYADFSKNTYLNRSTFKKYRKVLLIIFLLASLASIFYYSYYKDYKEKDDAYNLVKDYLSNTDDGEFDAENYFANLVSNFYDSLNVPVESITARTRHRTGTIIEKFHISKDSFNYDTIVGSITYWKYDNHYLKEDTLHQPPFFKGIIVTKVGINDENKITFIQEIGRRDTSWSDKMKEQ